MRVSTPRAIAFVSIFLTMQACAGSTATTSPGPSARPDSADLTELEALYRARADSARMRYTQADADFMRGMIVHHTQALIMSRLAPTHAGSDALRTLAARTINAQNDEISTMVGWLEDRDESVPEIEISGTHMMVEGAGRMESMPGILTDGQMQELAAARGEEFDRLFLTYMIEHHSGAVTMVHDLFNTDGAALDDAVFKIASDIQVDQTTEIHRMESMLEAMQQAGPRS
ncbi:MAG: DUF305 domain-containing protein [Gemmatimonadota bacterium]|jgi:uncharacterized protein (DUF305 family)